MLHVWLERETDAGTTLFKRIQPLRDLILDLEFSEPLYILIKEAD